jgi:hypothetical protein
MQACNLTGFYDQDSEQILPQRSRRKCIKHVITTLQNFTQVSLSATVIEMKNIFPVFLFFLDGLVLFWLMMKKRTLT